MTDRIWTKAQLPSLAIFDAELPARQERFERQPLTIVAEFLRCFDTEGLQRFDIPTDVLAALVTNFRRVLRENEGLSLDEAFGGCIARQRKRMLLDERNRQIEWAYQHAAEENKAAELKGNPLPEAAVTRVARKFNISEDAVWSVRKLLV